MTVQMKTNLIFFLARFGLGGAGNSVYRLVKSLDQKRFKISVICLGNCAYEKFLKKRGIVVHKLSSKKLLFSYFQLKKLVNHLFKNKTKNIFISNINYTNVFCSIIFWRNNDIKLIGIERTPLKELEIYFNLIDFFKKTILKILIHVCYARFDKIVCNSKYIADYLKKKYNYNSITIYPPSIETQKKINFKIQNFKKGKLNIVTVCRLSKEKGLNNLLYALALIKKKDFMLNIIGDGPERDGLINLVKNLELDKKVKFHGHNEYIFKNLKKNNLYINSSFFEGFPNSVVEAAYLGIPIISSQSHGGINEILSRGKFGTIYSNGYLELSAKIKEFIAHPKKFIEKAKFAKKNVVKFNLKNHTQNFEDLLKKI